MSYRRSPEELVYDLVLRGKENIVRFVDIQTSNVVVTFHVDSVSRSFNVLVPVF